MLKHLFLIASLLGSSAAFADAASLSGTVVYESRLVSVDGIEKRTRFSERLVRTDSVVWTERVIPANASHEKAAHEEGHDHLHPADLARAARYLSRNADGKLKLAFVLEDERTVVNAETRDFEQLGFDGNWPMSWSLFDPAQLKNLKKTNRKTAEAGAVWYETRGQGRFIRVLWSEPRRIALEIESGTDDGSRWNRTQVQLDVKAQATLPWQRLAKYQHKDYVDLLD
jgi:hypothetical protein